MFSIVSKTLILYEKNIQSLKRNYPKILEKLANSNRRLKTEVIETKNNLITLKVTKENGRSILLHSSYDPLSEAKKFISGIEFHHYQNIIILGFGLGYHVQELLKHINKDKNIYIIEKEIEIFRMALKWLDISNILGKRNITLLLDENWDVVDDLLIDNNIKNALIMEHRASMQINSLYYNHLKMIIAERLNREKRKILPKIFIIFPSPLPRLYAVAIPAANALKELGYLVYVFNFNEYYFSYLVELQGTICEKDAKKMAFRKIDKTVIEKIENFGPDIVIDFTANNPEVLKTIRNMNIILTQWLVEDYTIISYWKYVASYYDFFFVLERGPLFEELLKVKAKKVKYLPVACDSKIYKPLKLSVEDYDKFGCDVAFMGVPRKERIKMLEFFTNFNLGIWGKGWGEIDGKLKRYIRNNGKWVSGEEAAKIYNASKIILNLQISPFDKQKKANFVSPKTFSIAGCKGFQIADYRYEMKDLFKIGEEIICFNNFEELKELVKYYLDNEIERKRISKKAYQRVKSEHTYEHRMQEMIDFIRRHV